MSDISTDKAVMTASPLAVPDFALAADAPAVAAARGTALRAWLLAACLFLVPLLTYAPTTFHDYGLRDDYSNLREAHEEPGKILKFCASHARPIYGALLQASYEQTSSVQNLQWMRFAAALLLGTLSLVSFRSLRARVGRSVRRSALPCWSCSCHPRRSSPPGPSAGRTRSPRWSESAAFFATEGALDPGYTLRRAAAQWAVGLALMITGLLIYQPSALFYVVPLTAALLVRRDRTARQALRWAAIHAARWSSALGLAVCADECAVHRRLFPEIRPDRVRTALGREVRLVPARAAAERAEPVRAERQQSSRTMVVPRLRFPRRPAARRRRRG